MSHPCPRHPRPANRICLASATVLLLAAPLRAQEHPIQLTAKPAADSVRPGGRVTLAIDAQIPPGWHLYSITQPPGGPIATTIAVGPASRFAIAGTIDAPVPQVAADPNFGMVTEWYEDGAHFAVPLRAAVDAPAGETVVEARVGYQTCNARYCLPPTEDTLHVALAVAGAPLTETSPVASNTRIAGDEAASSPRPAAAPALVQVHGSRGLLLFLWLAATMGALSLLTPCVFPMVPITISYFSRREGQTRAQAVGGAALYAGGIIAAFTLLGAGLSAILGVTGLNRFAANPWLNLGIALLFIVFALSLFGVLNLALPGRLLTTLDRVATGSRVGRATGALLMGATFALTTFTCTAPFVGTLLTSAAQSDWRWPAAGLFVYALTFALPFFVLALVPQALRRLPRSGPWLATMKGTLGFIELAAAMKFLSNADLVQGWDVFTRNVVIAIWCALGILLALYLAGVRIRRPHWQGLAHPLGATVALGLTVWLSLGLTGRRLGELEPFLPPAGDRASGVVRGAELAWLVDDLDGGLRTAREQQKLVLIDFTGYTCTNCRWMEANMFPRRDVTRELEKFVRVRLFTDGKGEVYQKQQQLEQQRFHTVALPLYAIVDSLGQPRASFLGMTRDAREFVQFLSDVRGAN